MDNENDYEIPSLVSYNNHKTIDNNVSNNKSVNDAKAIPYNYNIDNTLIITNQPRMSTEMEIVISMAYVTH